MVAKTPHAKNHAGLAPLDSRFVDVDALPWQATRFPGVDAKTLIEDKETGLLTLLVRMAPGARLPDHEHVRIEQTYVLQGHLVCGEGEVTAGNYVWRPAGSRHAAWSPNGGLMIGVFLQPNRFFDQEAEAAGVSGKAAAAAIEPVDAA